MIYSCFAPEDSEESDFEERMEDFVMVETPNEHQLPIVVVNGNTNDIGNGSNNDNPNPNIDVNVQYSDSPRSPSISSDSTDSEDEMDSMVQDIRNKLDRIEIRNSIVSFFIFNSWTQLNTQTINEFIQF